MYSTVVVAINLVPRTFFLGLSDPTCMGVWLWSLCTSTMALAPTCRPPCAGPYGRTAYVRSEQKLLGGQCSCIIHDASLLRMVVRPSSTRLTLAVHAWEPRSFHFREVQLNNNTYNSTQKSISIPPKSVRRTASASQRALQAAPPRFATPRSTRRGTSPGTAAAAAPSARRHSCTRLCPW